MAAFKIRQTVDLNYAGEQPVTQINGRVGDALAHAWEVVLTRNGAAEDLTGYSALAIHNRIGGAALEIIASISGNVVTVTFPQASYVFQGRGQAVLLRVTKAATGEETTVAGAQLNVEEGEVGTPTDPGTSIATTLSGLLASEAARVTAEEGRVAAEAGRASALAAKVNREALLDTEMLIASATRHTGYVKPDGTFETGNESWFYTDYLPIKGDYIYIKADYCSSLAAVGYVFAFYDRYKRFVSGANGADAAIDAIVPIPKNAAYVIYSAITAMVTSTDVIKYKDGIPETVLSAKPLFGYPGYVKLDGTFASDASDWTHTGYLPLAFERLHVSMADVSIGIDTVGWNYAFYNIDKTFISGSMRVSETGAENADISTPANACFVIISNLSAKLADTDTISIKRVAPSNGLITVAKDGSADFRSVTEAVKYAMDGDRIYVKAGVYENEHIKAEKVNITIEGEGALKTILTCDDSEYPNPLVQVGSGAFLNLQLYRRGNKVDTEVNNGYVVHADYANLANGSLLYQNVIFRSVGEPTCIGLGMRPGCNIIFDSCQFLTNVSQQLVYMHDTTDGAQGIYNVGFRNCYFEGLGGPVIYLQSQENANSEIIMTWINNTFHSTNGVPFTVAVVNFFGGTSTDPTDFQGLINWKLKGCSHGNTLEALNA